MYKSRINWVYLCITSDFFLLQDLDSRIKECDDQDEIDGYNVIKTASETMIESIKQCIVLLQIAKVSQKQCKTSTL